MMKSKAIVFLLVTSAAIVKAQDKNKISIEPEPLVAKKTIHFGIQTGFSGGYNTDGNRVMSTYIINPKISYFIANRLSLGVGYMGMSSNMQPTRRNSFYHNGELELKYYFNNRSRTLFYSQLGILYGQYKPAASPNALYNDLGATLKLGAGVTWRFKNHPNLAINLEVNNYFNLGSNSGSKIKFAPNISIGFSFFMPHKKKKVISEKEKQLGEF